MQNPKAKLTGSLRDNPAGGQGGMCSMERTRT